MGGWLLFFTITLTVRALIDLFGALGALAIMVDKPGSELVLGTFATATLGLAGYTGWVAFAFWRLKPNAVRLLPAYFGALLGYGLIVAVLRFVPHAATPEATEILDAWAKTAFSIVVYIAIWTTYFRKSQRVANTFRAPIAPA
jgi:hypothetical protein